MILRLLGLLLFSGSLSAQTSGQAPEASLAGYVAAVDNSDWATAQQYQSSIDRTLKGSLTSEFCNLYGRFFRFLLKDSDREGEAEMRTLLDRIHQLPSGGPEDQLLKATSAFMGVALAAYSGRVWDLPAQTSRLKSLLTSVSTTSASDLRIAAAGLSWFESDSRLRQPAELAALAVKTTTFRNLSFVGTLVLLRQDKALVPSTVEAAAAFLVTHPNDFVLALEVARCQATLEKWDQAKSTLDGLLSGLHLQPPPRRMLTEAHYLLGRSLAQLGKPQDALMEFSVASAYVIAADPVQMSFEERIWLYSARILASQGRRDEALRFVEKMEGARSPEVRKEVALLREKLK